MPYKSFDIKLGEKEYKLKTLLFPINRCSLYYENESICRELFPKLKRYTLISFSISTMKKIAIICTLMFT
ncbi:MAG: hypothetical protein ACRDA5_06560 [Clostridium sp.]